MAFGSKGPSKDELLVRCAKLEAKLESKDEELERLRTQVDRLQDALVAKEAPEAFAESQRLRALSEITPEQKEIMDKHRRELVMYNDFLNELDNPTFSSVDELKATLASGLGAPKNEPRSPDPNEG